MAAFDFSDVKGLPPISFFRMQGTIRNKKNVKVLAYHQFPVLDENGEQVWDEEHFPDGRVLKRARMREDENRPVMHDMMRFRPAGSKDEFEVKAELFISDCEDKAALSEPAFPVDVAVELRRRYTEWKMGIDPKMQGWDLMTAEFLPLATRQHLRQIGLQTVEQVAAANEQVIMAIGVGGRAIKNTASAKLEARAKETVEQNNAELIETKSQLSAMQKQLTDLTALLANAGLKVPEAAPVAPAPVAAPAAAVVEKLEPMTNDEPVLTVNTAKPTKAARKDVGSAVDDFLSKRVAQ